MNIENLLKVFFGWCPTVESASEFIHVKKEFTHAWCWNCGKYVDVKELKPEEKEPDILSELSITYYDYTFLDRIKDAESRFKIPPWKLRCPFCGSMGLTLQSPEDREKHSMIEEV